MDDPFTNAKWAARIAGLLLLAAASPLMALAAGAAVRAFLWASGL